MMNISKFFVINKVKILLCVQFLKDNLIIEEFIHTFDNKTITIDSIFYLKFKQCLLNFIIDSINY